MARVPTGDVLSPDAIWFEVEKILTSRTFRSASAQREFLRHAVAEKLQGRGHLLKEYSIGIAVFHKKESFDPRLDSIVRSEARKLRARLERYFASEGADDPVRIELPLGRYTPVFTARTQLAAPPAITTRALRIAVLPFENRSAAKRDEYFADGLTDELSHAFTQVRGLEVVARASAFQFKGQPVDVRDVGRKLNVHAVIEGSVRRSGDRLRILAQLDDAVNGNTVWSESYDRRLSDLFEVQTEIAGTITSELSGHFRKALPRNSGSRSLPPGVYEDYLRGQYFWNRHTVEGFESAIACFEQVVARDPGYARAYTGLAYCYVMLPILKAVPSAEFIPRVQVSASKALEFDSNAGEAHIALALPLVHEYNWRAADKEFRAGLKLCPSDVVGHAWYGTYLLSVGRNEEAVREHKKVLELDPASAPAVNCYAQTLYYLRRHNDAAEQFRKALKLDPSLPRAHAGLGLAYLQSRNYARAIAALERAHDLTQGPGRVKADLAYAYAVSGNRDKAQGILNEFLRQFDAASFPALMIAQIFIGLGDHDGAFEWLHRVIDQRDLALFLKPDPLYDPLRADPRFASLLKRTHLA